MKYGRILHIGYSRGIDKSEKREINIGDIFECMALENVYDRMGIDKSQIVNCYQHQIKDYEGEYIVLPVNFYYTSARYSSRILPVFLGLTVGGQHELSDEEYTTLRRFSPVGCRDERTLRRLLDKGIDAYFNGCMVATFPEREQGLETQDTVFFADPQKGIKDYIPEELLKKYKFVYHDIYAIPEELSEDGNLMTYGKKILETYSREAKLVVTSRFHAAVMCLALGIPVILTMENNYYKYTWIQKYIPVYEPKDFDKIDWNPPVVTIPKEEKELMLDIACSRVKETYDKYYKICTLSEKRETIEIKEFDDIFYGSYAIQYMQKNWPKDIEIKYAFWGATQIAKKLQKFIEENYPNAKLHRVYDLLVKNEFLGLMPKTPDTIENDDPCFIFVTGQSVVNAARDKFKAMNKPESEYFMCQRQFLSEKDFE